MIKDENLKKEIWAICKRINNFKSDEHYKPDLFPEEGCDIILYIIEKQRYIKKEN